MPTPGPVAAAPVAPHAGFAVPTVPMDTQHPPFTVPLAPVMALVLPNYSFPTVTPSLPQAFFPGQPNFLPEMIPASQPELPGRTSPPKQPCACPRAECGPPASRAATPASLPSASGPTGRASPPLFESRGSSPLQLNLLQLEEAPEGSAVAATTAGSSETTVAGPDCNPGTAVDRQPKPSPIVRTPPPPVFLL